MVDLLSAAGLGLEALKAIKKKTDKKLIVSPTKIVARPNRVGAMGLTLSIHNMTSKPMHYVCIVLWTQPTISKLNFNPVNIKKEVDLGGGVSVDKSFLYQKGRATESGVDLYLLHLHTVLIPSGHVEIEVEVEGYGEVDIEPLDFSAKLGSARAFTQGNELYVPFQIPFAMEIDTLSAGLRNSNAKQEDLE